MMQAGLPDFAAFLFAVEAQQDAALGYPAEVRTKAAKALELSKTFTHTFFGRHCFRNGWGTRSSQKPSSTI